MMHGFSVVSNTIVYGAENDEDQLNRGLARADLAKPVLEPAAARRQRPRSMTNLAREGFRLGREISDLV
jgi:hypothetical protein